MRRLRASEGEQEGALVHLWMSNLSVGVARVLGMKFTQMRALFQSQVKVANQINAVLSLEKESADSASLEVESLKRVQVVAELRKLPVERIKDATQTKMKIEYLRRSGYENIAEVYLASRGTLASISGIGPDVAIEIKSIVDSMAKALGESMGLRISPSLESEEEQRLVHELEEIKVIRQELRTSRERLPEIREKLATVAAEADLAKSRIRWWFAGKDKRQMVLNSISNAAILLGAPDVIIAVSAVEGLLTKLPSKERSVAEVKDLFATNSSTYYSILEDVQGGPALGKTASHFSQELIQAIEAHPFDDSLVKASMRKYQTFGTKFALEQRRVILGDEMGLGKTMQALGVLTERHKAGAFRMLVVCHASVIINWTREIMDRTDLIPLKIHGDTQKENLQRWIAHGGLALTTFDTLKSFGIDEKEILDFDLDTLVVDEAHFAKNLDTGRSKEIQRWTRISEYVLFLTGTPMENRIDEFVRLVSLLDRNMAEKLDMAVLAAGSGPFKIAVAPVYLRRNGLEVLKELPDLIETQEDCDWSGVSKDFYTKAVTDGNFMSMRRAAFVPAEGFTPSKMERLLELVQEAFDNDEKVIVFSYFRKVIDSVMFHLEDKAVGPITGSVSPAKRQELIDTFTNSSSPKVLVGQIQAAGTGLNIQSASVVILCEPQIKPSLETQAIARAHRMGQIKTVQVHRLHIETSVDAGLRKMLAMKQDEFDDYARESALAEGSKDAKSNSEHSHAKVILLEERKRLNIHSHTDVILEEE